jgi:C-terminal processing protease CtpA/Prc
MIVGFRNRHDIAPHFAVLVYHVRTEQMWPWAAGSDILPRLSWVKAKGCYRSGIPERVIGTCPNAVASRSIVTEGLGARPFHGRTVLLVDESTTGAGERIAAFAQEQKLAPVVGGQTAGRLICCSVYKISHGYYIRIPARAWYTWRGELLEGKGIQPDARVPGDHSNSRDVQMQKAVEIVQGL